MSFPPASQIQVSTVPLNAFLTRESSILAAGGTSSPLAEINFLNATVKVGDGAVGSSGPQIPSISTLQANNALVHQVWSGTVVQACSQNPTNPNQIDILCVIPAVDASGNEIGPFWVTEFIITDENGTAMIAGTTVAPKLVTANGAATDLAFIASVAFSLGTVVLTAPSAPFLTENQIQAALANEVTPVAPITVTSSTDSQGWEHFAVGIDPKAVFHYGPDTSSTADAIVATVAPAVTTLAAGMTFAIKLANGLTGASTAAINGLAAVPVTRADGTPTQQGDGVAGEVLQLIYDGANLQIAGLLSTFVPAHSLVTLSTSQNFTAPQSGFYEVEGWGGGGGGGGAANASCAASGGSGAAHFHGVYYFAKGQVVPCTIGAGGAPGAAGGGNGSPGGATSFGSLANAPGGLGGFGSTSGVQFSAPAGPTATGGTMSNDTGAGGNLGYPVGGSLYTGGTGGPSFGGQPSQVTVNAPGADGAAAGCGAGGASTNAPGGTGALGKLTIKY